jgi:hypothetical protein
MKSAISETARAFLRAINLSEDLGGLIKVTFNELDLGSYDDNEEMQNGIAEIIKNDLVSEKEEEGEEVDHDSLRDEAIEQSLSAIEAFENNTLPAEASVITVNVDGIVDAYNGMWTFEFQR